MKQVLTFAGVLVVAVVLGSAAAQVALDRAPGRDAFAGTPALDEATARGTVDAAAPTVAAGAGGGETEDARGIPPVARWSERFRTLVSHGEWDELLALLATLESRAPRDYAHFSLGYLHARAALQAGEAEEARERLRPWLRDSSPFASLALHHAAAAADADGDAAEAARLRRELLRAHPGSFYWQDALAAELARLDAEGDHRAMRELVAEVLPAVREERLARDLRARRVAALHAGGNPSDALREGLALLFRSTADDAAERVAAVLDDSEILPRLSPAELRRLAEAMHLHRRWHRAVELLELARERLPRERSVIDFAIGRARFFAGEYTLAREAYLRAVPLARTPEERARCFFHAARAAQLLGDDTAAEELMTKAIAVPGRHAATTAALTARLRLRVGRGDLAAALGDLDLLRRLFPRDPALVEGAVAFAMGELAAGRPDDALGTLASLRPVPFSPHQAAEVGYWRGRALEGRDRAAALAAYLDVLRADVPTHFAYLARRRLREPGLAAAAAARANALRQEAAAQLGRGDAEAARRAQTDAVLLAGNAADLERLAAIYRRLPAYRRVLELQPLPLPSLGANRRLSRGEHLAALGLLDEAAPAIPSLYPLAPMRSGLTRAFAFRLGGASRQSILAAESLAEQVPDDYVPQLLDPLFRELLYPRYFWDWITVDAGRYGADPRLLVSIMREESRFNPRAKSPAAARGLMQLLLGTARQVAVSLELMEVAPEDLYDPRLVIRLGAKYVGDLMAALDGDRYATAAAYNAGPDQARLWQRLAPAEGADYFLSTVSFAETKHYVRKVLNSYERYGEIYQGEAAAGGTRAEP
jgi:soluble lytic murein transglycosylase-like protein